MNTISGFFLSGLRMFLCLFCGSVCAIGVITSRGPKDDFHERLHKLRAARTGRPPSSPTRSRVTGTLLSRESSPQKRSLNASRLSADAHACDSPQSTSSRGRARSYLQLPRDTATSSRSRLLRDRDGLHRSRFSHARDPSLAADDRPASATNSLPSPLSSSSRHRNRYTTANTRSKTYTALFSTRSKTDGNRVPTLNADVDDGVPPPTKPKFDPDKYREQTAGGRSDDLDSLFADGAFIVFSEFFRWARVEFWALGSTRDSNPPW